MELSDIKERLEKLDSAKLIDVVKNYRQYCYSEEIRNYALTLLEKQGITRSDLQLTGNLENAQYNYGCDVFSSFKRNSTTAFVFYGLALTLKLVSFFFQLYATWLLVAIILSFLVFMVFLFLSFLDQAKFYKLAGDEYGVSGAIGYLFLGMPFYIVMYFVFRAQMNEKLKMIT